MRFHFIIRLGFLYVEQRASLETLVRQASGPHRGVRRANALLLPLDDGLSCEAIARVLYIDDDTVLVWHERWTAGGN